MEEIPFWVPVLVLLWGLPLELVLEQELGQVLAQLQVLVQVPELELALERVQEQVLAPEQVQVQGQGRGQVPRPDPVVCPRSWVRLYIRKT